MQTGWYILNYHDISWEENPYLQGIGGTFPPDIFREHLQSLQEHGRLVSIQEGFERFQSSTIDAPLFSFWFDDGFAGVRRYAKPIMDTFGVTGAISINSRFTLRQEMFWRAKLSYLSQCDGLRFVRSRLRPLGYTLEQSLKAFTMDHFSPEIIGVIDAVYRNFAPEHVQRDAFRLFDTMQGIKALQEAGWEIANHTCAHYPVSEASHMNHFAEEFHECETALNTHLGITTDFWVVPFDRKSLALESLMQVFTEADSKGRHLVLVGDKINHSQTHDQKVLHRIEPPYLDGKGLVRYIGAL
jgi:peptidoglycan/xylan/chitin deacetylase (PgdA/CDA1 family)